MPAFSSAPYIHPDGVWTALAIFLVLNPLVYYAFIQAFRLAIHSPFPMTIKQAIKLAGIRAAWDVFWIGGAWLILIALDHHALWSLFSAYLYCEQFLAWAALGWCRAHLSGRRFVAWTLSGTALSFAFIAAVSAGYLTGQARHLLLLALLGGLIAGLHLLQWHASRKRPFPVNPCCGTCHCSLIGNLSSICPECARPAALPTLATPHSISPGSS